MITKGIYRHASTFLKVGVSVGLLAWFLMRTDRSQLVHSFSSVPLWLWPLLLMLYLVSQCISTTRWRMLAEVLGFRGRWIDYFNYYFSGMFFNLFMPTSIGGDVIKIFFISRGGDAKRKLLASYSVFADRLFGLFSLLLLGAGAVLISPGLLPSPFPEMLCIAGALVIIVLLCAPLVQRLASRIPWPPVAKALEVLLIFWKHPRVLASCLLFSIMIQTICIIICILAGSSMGIKVPTLLYFAAFPLVALMTMIPISIGGIGVREGGFVYFLGFYGVSDARAVTLSLAFFSVQFAASLIGGIIYSTGGYKKREIHP